MPIDGRHFLRGFYLDIRDGAIEAAGFFEHEHPGYNVFHRNVQHTVSRFDPAKCKRRLSANEPLFMPPRVTLELYRGGEYPSASNRPTLVLESDLNSVRLIGSCALDNTILVDHEFPQLLVAPADAAGFSVTSLRGSFMRLTLDFFYIKSVACLPEQSWPRLHNVQLLLGARRHALTFTLDDLSDQITRLNPKPIAMGDAVTPQIVFEREIDRERFERNLKTVVRNAS